MPIESDMVVSRHLTYRLREVSLRFNRNAAEPWVMVKGRQVFTGERSRCVGQMGGSCNRPMSCSNAPVANSWSFIGS